MSLPDWTVCESIKRFPLLRILAVAKRKGLTRSAAGNIGSDSCIFEPISHVSIFTWRNFPQKVKAVYDVVKTPLGKTCQSTWWNTGLTREVWARHAQRGEQEDGQWTSSLNHCTCSEPLIIHRVPANIFLFHGLKRSGQMWSQSAVE